MAAIGKIREKSGLLLITIGLAMAAFILTDLFKPSGQGEQEPLGTIYGEPVDGARYREMLDIEMENERRNLAQQNQEMTPQKVEEVKQRVWDNFVRETIMSFEFQKLGIETTSDELNAFVVGDFTHDQLKQIPFFQDASQQFSKDSLIQFVNQLNSGNTPQDVIQWWSGIEQFIKEDRQIIKYLTLIEKGLYVTEAEAKHQYTIENEIKNVRFVLKRYNNIPDEEVELTDEDIRGYYEEHKNDKSYEQQESVEIKFIEIPVNISENDELLFADRMQSLKEKFEKTGNDSLFVMSNAENGQYSPGKFFSFGDYPKEMDEAIQNAEKGDVIGPYTEEGKVKLAKVIDYQTQPQAKVRHILLSTNQGQDSIAVKKTADSLVNVIKRENNFEAMVTEFSQDPGSVENGGVYEWFPEGMMVPSFEKAAFEGTLNQLQIVRTTYGYHIVEPLGRREGKSPNLAIVDKSIAPSEESIETANAEALDFMYIAVDANNFDSLASDSGYIVKPAKVTINQNMIPGIDRVDRIKRWTFSESTKPGDISEPFKIGDKFVIVSLERKINEGVPEFEDVKEIMRAPAMKKKKADIYIAKMNDKSSLQQVADAVNESILSADLKFSTNALKGGGGNEPKVIGTVFSIEEVGVMTKAIEGNTGVYVIEIVNTQSAPETTDYMAQKSNLQNAWRNGANREVYKALFEKAEVEDNRKKVAYKY